MCSKLYIQNCVPLLCSSNDLRNLFPQMGTAHGINLKKMGTLAKGVGIIYRIKVEEFASKLLKSCFVRFVIELCNVSYIICDYMIWGMTIFIFITQRTLFKLLFY